MSQLLFFLLVGILFMLGVSKTLKSHAQRQPDSKQKISRLLSMGGLFFLLRSSFYKGRKS